MNSPRYEQLLERLLEGELSGAEAEELANGLRKRPELQRDLRSHLVLWDLWSQQHKPERSSGAFLNAWRTRLRVEREDADGFAKAIESRISAPHQRTGAIELFARSFLGAILQPKGVALAASLLIGISAAVWWFVVARSSQAVTVLEGEAVCTACVLHETQEHAPALRVVVGPSTNIHYLDRSPAVAALQDYFCRGPTAATAEGKARTKEGRRMFQAAKVTIPEAHRPREQSTGAAIKEPRAASAQTPAKRYPLEDLEGLRFHNVTAEPSVLQGKKGLRATISEEALRRIEGTAKYAQGLVWIEGVDFSNGVIEAEIAGDLAPGAGGQSRGFVGIAFRVQPNLEAYDAFYLRPTNGRAEDQERRNHSVQYISLPQWPWSRLRQEAPSKYEAYVDLVPGAWTKIKIDVRGEQARLYVHDNEQPTLIVKDLKSGANGQGGVALWLEPGTVAHFRNLTVEPSTAPSSDEAPSAQGEGVRNSAGMQLRVVEENTDPTLRIVLPGHPTSDRAIEIIFPEHVTVRKEGDADGKQIYLFQPGQSGERPLWRRSERSLEYERSLPGAVQMFAQATVEDDGVRFRISLKNQSDMAYDLAWAIIDPRLTSMFHDVRLERTYVHHADGFDLLASETPSRLTMPLSQWLPARYLASFTWPIPSQRVERRGGIPHYTKSRAVDAPFIATLSQDRRWVVASFSRGTGNVWSNPELTCQHVDPPGTLSPRGEAILQTKLLVVRGSLDDAFKIAMPQRKALEQ
ncbi:MAG: hypothetical protein U1G07_05750 [Verrucomicrobiota bacterium]